MITYLFLNLVKSESTLYWPGPGSSLILNSSLLFFVDCAMTPCNFDYLLSVLYEPGPGEDFKSLNLSTLEIIHEGDLPLNSTE